MLDNSNLIRKTRFPRQLVPLSVVFAHLVSFAVMLALLLVVNFIALARVRATEWLAIPLAALFAGVLPRWTDVLYLVVACVAALAVGALVFRSVDDQIAIEV